MYTENDVVQLFQKIKKKYNSDQYDYKRNLKRFFYKANFEYKLYKKVKKEVDRYLSLDFNILNIIQPDENKISDLIKILLEPNGIHGQGNKFLDLFLSQLKNLCKKDYLLNLNKVSIKREATTLNNRRIDLLIEFENLIIGIENKPWAGEGDEQLGDYYTYLKQQNKEFLLIFLPGTRREPVSISEENKKSEKFIVFSYKELLIPWLEECYKNCESQKVRFFIKDFIDWINNNFKETEEY